MRKPIYMSKVIASWFFFTGGLCFFKSIITSLQFLSVLEILGIQYSYLVPMTDSDYGQSLILILIGLTFEIISRRKIKTHENLLLNGEKFIGKVEKVEVLRKIGLVNNLYRVCYTYVHKESQYHKKSYLLRVKPNLKKGDTLTVYINPQGESTLDL